MNRWLSWTATCAACLLILCGALAETLGFGSGFILLASRSPSIHLAPIQPKTIFLKVSETSQGIDPLDVAMALRGLGMLHPRCIVIPGDIQNGDATRFLDGLINRLRSRDTPSVSVVLKEQPGDKTSIRRFPATTTPIVPSGGIGSPFHPNETSPFVQPSSPASKGLLPLLTLAGTSSDPHVTPWWNSLPTTDTTDTVRLFFGKLLLLSNNSPLLLHGNGSYESRNPPYLPVVSLDDFLLRIEQMERGSISPNFTASWNGATVVIGGDLWENPASILASLLQWISLKRLPLSQQAVLAAIFVLAFLCGYRLRSGSRLMISGLLTLSLLVAWLAFLKQGTLIPLLPGLITAVLVAIPWKSPETKGVDARIK